VGAGGVAGHGEFDGRWLFIRIVSMSVIEVWSWLGRFSVGCGLYIIMFVVKLSG
jgi:hypothetical protein